MLCNSSNIMFIMFNDVQSPRSEQIHFCKLFPFISDLEKVDLIKIYKLNHETKAQIVSHGLRVLPQIYWNFDKRLKMYFKGFSLSCLCFPFDVDPFCLHFPAKHTRLKCRQITHDVFTRLKTVANAY